MTINTNSIRSIVSHCIRAIYFPQLEIRRMVFIFFILFSISVSLAQTNKGEIYQYARKVVDTLTSESMHGRGYVNNGDGIAANYIRSEFKRFGLKSFTDDYYQHLTFPVNTFPGKMSVSVNGKELIPGKDYIVHSSNFSCLLCANHAAEGVGKAVLADDALVMNKTKFDKFSKKSLSEKILVVNDTGKQTPELKALPNAGNIPLAIVTLKDKLTWTVPKNVPNYPQIEILRASLTGKIKKVSFSIENKFIPEYQSQNVVSYVKGSEHPDSFIVFSAHYDHLGQMGDKVYFPGANDNASGCSMLLNLAKYYSMPEHQPKYSIAFIAFCGEEAGLLGSKYYSEHPLFPLKNISFMWNMDLMGTGVDGITIVNGSVFKNEFEKIKEINSKNNLLKEVRVRGKAANSDHYWFSEAGVHAVFSYTMGGIAAYHDIYDRAETLPLDNVENLFKLITLFCGDFQR